VPDILSKPIAQLNLISSLVIKSPAPHILTSSQYLLLTLHSDNILRLWSIDDGRCLLASSHTMIESKTLGMTHFADYPGYVAIAGDKSDVYIVNVFTMEVENHLGLLSQGYHSLS